MQRITHSDRVFTIPSLLDRAECTALIALAEASGFEAAGVRTMEGQKAMPNVRNNERTIVEDASWVGALWERLLAVGMPEVQGESALGLPQALRFYKYTQGQRFRMHKDGPWKERGLTSKLTFLVYLNEAFEGGETDFREFKIKPATGDALLFVHDTWHEGAAVASGVKYVLRSDVLYSGPSAT